jgi:hypothetical protein
MVIALGLPSVPSGQAKTGLSLESIQDVWKFIIVVGLAAVLISWTRESKPR